MKRYPFLLVLIFSILICGCSKNADTPEQTSIPAMSVDFNRENICIVDSVPEFGDRDTLRVPGQVYDGVIQSSYYRIPASGHLNDGDGLFLICADEQEMNQGNHYDAFLVSDHDSRYLPRYFFLQEYHFFEQTIPVAFEYTVFENRYVITYVSSDMYSFRIYTDQQVDGNIILVFDIASDDHYFSYPVFLDPQTGICTDFLAAISPDKLPSESINSFKLMEKNRLLLRMNGGAYYFYDTPNGSVYPLSDLLGYTPQSCAAVSDGIVCHDGNGRFQIVDTENLTVSDIDLDVSQLVLFYGLTTSCNQTFALYRDTEGLLRGFDFITMEDFPLSEPANCDFDPDRMYPSYDGRRLFLFRLDEQDRMQLLIFDCDLSNFILLEQDNPNPVRETRVSWQRDGSLVIGSESGQDFYVYQWKEQDTQMTDTEITVSSQPRDTDFVPVLDYIPDLVVEMKYAYPDNFTGHAIYEFEEAWLRYGTVKKLMAVQDALRPMGLGLKLWDGFRPVAAQFKLWEILPDDTYVANPKIGFSSHSRGNTVDITLVDRSGVEVPMPTGFDDFSALADRDYSDCPAALADNAILLENIMQEKGFVGYFGEWWHFADSVKYDVEKCFNPGIISTWYADCNEYISLRSAPDTSSQVLDRIPVRETCTLLGYTGDFALVDFRGQRGYVLSAYLKQVP